jgi:hypothetical protein
MEGFQNSEYRLGNTETEHYRRENNKMNVSCGDPLYMKACPEVPEHIPKNKNHKYYSFLPLGNSVTIF